MDRETYEKRLAMIAGLTGLARVLALHSECELPFEGTDNSTMHIFCHTRKKFEATLKSFGVAINMPISVDPDGWLRCQPWPEFNFCIMGNAKALDWAERTFSKQSVIDKPAANIVEAPADIESEVEMWL